MQAEVRPSPSASGGILGSNGGFLSLTQPFLRTVLYLYI